MSRINTNVQSLIAQNAFNNNQSSLNTSLRRLSTGLQINSGADDPAGLIASQNLLANQAGITSAISNANLANNVISTADGGLGEINTLLTQVQGLVSQAASTGGLSSQEIGADQQQVDSILNTINRIANSTSFDGTQLLNGNLDYTVSGVAAANISDVHVQSATVPNGGNLAVSVDVVGSAKTADLTYTGGSIGTGGVTLQIGGNLGTTQITLASGTSISQIASAVNGTTNNTGLSATVNGSTLTVNSQGFGSSQFVTIQAVSGSFSGLSGNKASGTDANVLVNGSKAVADGKSVSYSSSDLSVSFNLTKTFNTPGSSSFHVTGGGATFAIGSQVTANNNASIGIQSVSTASLGDTVNGFLDTLASGGKNSLSSNNLNTAQTILNNAINQVSELRGNLGSFQKYTIGSTLSTLNVAFENSSAASSNIEDTDFAAETSNLTRAQILSSAATSVLSQANSNPQNVLKLLG
jgi:flagellin